MDFTQLRWCDWCQDHTLWHDDECQRCKADIAEQDSLRAELENLRAINAELLAEMKRYLPVLQALENKPSAWEWYTDSTGIATLNGYRNAIAKAGSARVDLNKPTPPPSRIIKEHEEWE